MDWQLTDTYFVVAHLHYVLIGINLFPVVGAVYFWFPKMTGRLLDERLGRWNFWTMFIGFNLAFLPMHLTGLLGMPRRVYTYGAAHGLDHAQSHHLDRQLRLCIGVLLLFVNVVKSRRSGAVAGPTPGMRRRSSGRSLRRRRVYNFAVIPVVATRHPLWEGRLTSMRRALVAGAGLSARRRQGDHRHHGARRPAGHDSGDARGHVRPVDARGRPALTFAGLMLKLWWIVGLATAVTALALLAWLWPRRALREREAPMAEDCQLAQTRPCRSGRPGAGGWAGGVLAP